MNKLINFIKADFDSHPIRFVVEVLAATLMIVAALILAITSPYPPMMYVYMCWLPATAMLIGCSFYRKSFGLVAIYFAYMFIDGYGFIRTLIN